MLKLKTAASLMALGLCLVATQGMAAGGGTQLEKADIDPDNKSSLQRGARNFMNYCSGCHSAQYVRYNTIGKYLGLSEEQLIDNLMFNAEKTFETIRATMPTDDAARWYGVAPPDLSLMARAKGADYVFNFLKGFYVSESSPTGVDNLVLAGTSMPHVLWELQGYQTANFSTHNNDDGSVEKTFEGFEVLSAGSMDAEDYDEFVRDTVNFLAYIAEPIRSDRRKLGVWVLMFLIFFFILASMLKKQIWKDVN
ncbi:MAG: cytochrome c1 [Gammaproteobacteria bacterium]|nr:cytochrome c1 [Gammaproteobacteria bacterium]MBU2678249.1 cytochrome c1 [Gammaproteobacteria bacterium]NNL51984.1 cytochrome c1 [Woeseiaceae bacterium]